jgi:hypothetical protein
MQFKSSFPLFLPAIMKIIYFLFIPGIATDYYVNNNFKLTMVQQLSKRYLSVEILIFFTAKIRA